MLRRPWTLLIEYRFELKRNDIIAKTHTHIYIYIYIISHV